MFTEILKEITNIGMPIICKKIEKQMKAETY